MALLSVLTHAEGKQLEDRLMEAFREVNEELDHLERLNPLTRSLLYGPGLIRAYQGVRFDLLDILADDIPHCGTAA